MTKTYELPNKKMLMADVDEIHHTATVSVFALDSLVEAVNKTGHWKPTIVRGSESYTCSECYAECCYVTTNYCPSCGARMVGDNDLGDYPDTIPNQFDNMTGSMNL